MKIINSLKNPSKAARVILIVVYALMVFAPFVYLTFDLFNDSSQLESIESMSRMEFLTKYSLPFIIGQVFLLIYFVLISDWKKLLFTRFSKLDELEKRVLYKIIFLSYMFFVSLTILDLVFYGESGIVEVEMSRLIPLGQLISYITIPILVGFYYDEELVE